MRIRKRFPLSHPHLNRPLVTSPPPSDPPNHPQPSDQIPHGRTRCVSSQQQLGSTTTSLLLKQKEGEETCNDTSIIGETDIGIGFYSTTDIEVVPSKKSKPVERDMKMKPKPSKKFFRKRGLDKLQECSGNKDGTTSVGEGLRCSRANGRGWRCSQKPLVGYSLCEHHLGKGRLRSLKKSNPIIKRADEVANLSSSSSSQLGGKFIDEDDSDGKKFGMVMKARSLTTLLGQTMELG